MTIDVHTHFIPVELAEYMMAHQEETDSQVEIKDGVYWIRKSGFNFPLIPEFYSADKRFADMDACGLDKGVLSVSPLLFFYDSPLENALQCCWICNNWAADMVRKYPERLEAMAMVPMQDIDAAVREMERAHEDLGMNAVEIAPVINGRMMDDTYFFPFYEYCEKEGILIYLHPAQTDRSSPYDKYHSMNLIGYVQETNWALTRLIFGGVLKKFPNLKILASHGGGHFPYQFGRLMHGYEVRQEAKVNIQEPPINYLSNIYFDTITHWKPSLQFLVDNFGADHVLMGTDYPYDMADFHPVESVEALRLSRSEREKILADNTLRLLSGE